MADDTNQRLLRALRIVPKNGHLEPSWEPRARIGAMYNGAHAGLDEDQLAADLETLADRGFLDRKFVERLMICPTCDSHAVNVHEACVTCNSANLKLIKSYFHFRCGFVGPEQAFTEEPGGLRCPKCKGLLADLGTDHDSPGEFFECLNCAAMFQQPQMAVRCLSCGGSFVGSTLRDLRHKDIFAYRLTMRGEGALSRGTLDP